MSEACELIVSQLSIQWKIPKRSSLLFFFPLLLLFYPSWLCSCPALHMCRFHIFGFFSVVCVLLNSTSAPVVPLPAGDGERGDGGREGSSFCWTVILF